MGGSYKIDPLDYLTAKSNGLEEEAQEILEQIEHSKLYYAWLSTLTDALNSGEIFDYFPIPENKL